MTPTGPLRHRRSTRRSARHYARDRRRQRHHAGAVDRRDRARGRAGAAGSRWSTATARAASMMFLEELADLKDRYPDRLQLVHVLSREPQDVDAAVRAGSTRDRLAPAARHAGAGRRRSTSGSCAARSRWCERRAARCSSAGVDRRAHPPRAVPRRRRAAARRAAAARPTAPPAAATRHDHARRPRVDASTVPRRRARSSTPRCAVRADAPYACKGGVCGTCRAKLVEGEVAMDRNYALEPDEIDAGLRADLPVATRSSDDGRARLRRLSADGRRTMPR